MLIETKQMAHYSQPNKVWKHGGCIWNCIISLLLPTTEDSIWVAKSQLGKWGLESDGCWLNPWQPWFPTFWFSKVNIDQRGPEQNHSSSERQELLNDIMDHPKFRLYRKYISNYVTCRFKKTQRKFALCLSFQLCPEFASGLKQQLITQSDTWTAV